MTIAFPNASRSYDSTRRVVRFWGHDSAMETPFFITFPALQRIQPGIADDEASVLAAFDCHRPRICAAAAKAYGRTRRGFYELGAADF